MYSEIKIYLQENPLYSVIKTHYRRNGVAQKSYHVQEETLLW